MVGKIVAAALCLATGILPGCAPQTAGTLPADPAGFTAAVFQKFAASRLPDGAAVVAPLTLTARSADGGTVRLGLDRIYAACQQDSSGCPTLVDRFVGATAETLRIARPPLTRDMLRAVIRPDGYVRASQLAEPYVRPSPSFLPTGLSVLVYADEPNAMRMVRLRDLDAMQLSGDAAYAIALRNTTAALRPTDGVVQPLPPRGIGVLRESEYESSRLLLHPDWAEAAARFGGRLIVAVPSAEEVFYADGSSQEAIGALTALARDRFAKADRRISPAVYRWEPDRWVPLTTQ